MEEEVRKAGVDFVMELLRATLHERRLMPVLMVAVGEAGDACVFPGGPGMPREEIIEFLERAARDLRAGH